MEQDIDKLEARAEAGVNALYEIESEVFAFTAGPMGTVILKHRRNWPSTDPGEVTVYVRPD
ncbi:MAG TPA: hypothetical protein VMV69_27285 [Pirellulales bacterium]|nr:hypothetical protein [Pirellulales bacterium]